MLEIRFACNAEAAIEIDSIGPECSIGRDVANMLFGGGDILDILGEEFLLRFIVGFVGVGGEQVVLVTSPEVDDTFSHS
jgi:hypothetical protein